MNANYTKILQEDLDLIKDYNFQDFRTLENSSVLISGTTGLIGKTLVQAILANTESTRILALVRNKAKAEQIFAHVKGEDRLSFIVSDITTPITLEDNVDYIIHGASQTSSKAFVEEPVETILTAIRGTQNMLEIAYAKKAKGMVYLSSMEVYGAPTTKEKIAENHPTNLDTTAVRTSYPESKRMCESLCTAFANEYNVNARIIRLTQTFGPGIVYDDSRVFAEFARCAIESKDITLHTKGETERNYLYTADAVSAILKVLLHGKNGEAYNAANEKTYCSILEMANLVASKVANSKIKVLIEEGDISKFGYAPPLKMNLDTTKLRSLGWRPTTELEEMFKRMIACIP